MWIYSSRMAAKNIEKSSGEYQARYLDELDAEYEGLVKTEIPRLIKDEFGEFKRSGERLRYEKIYFTRRTMLRDFALKLWLGDKSAAEPLEAVINAICDEFTWILPAHENGGDLRTSIDLFAAETAQTLTEIVALTGDRLTEETRQKAIGEVRARVLVPFMTRIEKYGWETSESNWSAVCGGCVGMTVLYLVEDTEEVKKLLNPLEDTFKSYMKSFTDDGACLEGLYYWGYGMTYFTAFLELYRERMGEEFPVDRKKLIKMADFAHKCCIADGITVSFSDGNEYDRVYGGLASHLAQVYGAAPVPEEFTAYFAGDDCGRWCRAARDLAWRSDMTAKPLPRMSVLPKAQWAVFRGGDMAFAVKGGNNGEPHNHNDIGGFIAVAGGKIIISDLGAGEYTRDYFSGKRYDIFCNRSMGHSVPVIDGKEQKAGREYGASGFEARDGYVKMDISGAYGYDKLKSLIREIQYEDGKIILTDTFELERGAEIRERFIVADDIPALEAGCKCTREVNVYEHYTHEGRIKKIQAVDFVFNAEKTYTFSIIIKE